MYKIGIFVKKRVLIVFFNFTIQFQLAHQLIPEKKRIKFLRYVKTLLSRHQEFKIYDKKMKFPVFCGQFCRNQLLFCHLMFFSLDRPWWLKPVFVVVLIWMNREYGMCKTNCILLLHSGAKCLVPFGLYGVKWP